MSEQELELRVTEAEKVIDAYKKRFFSIRRELDDVETLLVTARETKRKAVEELYEFRRTQVGEFSLDDERNKQIADYKSRMPASLAAIAHEKPIPYKTISELETIAEWPKSRYGNEIEILDD